MASAVAGDGSATTTTTPAATPAAAAAAAGSLTLLAVLKGHEERVWHVSWNPVHELLASCGGDRAIALWAPAKAADSTADTTATTTTTTTTTTTNQWTRVAVLPDAAARTVRCVEWSPCGNYLAAGSFDGKVRVYERVVGASSMPSLRPLCTLEGPENEIKSVSWSRSGALLATCSRDKSVWVWETPQDAAAGSGSSGFGAGGDGGEYECRAVLHGHSQDVKAVAFHPLLPLLVSASYDDTLRVWEEDDEEWICTEVLSGHKSTVWQLSFDADGDRLVSASDDNTLRVWRRYKGLATATADATASATTAGTTQQFRTVATLSGAHNRTVFSVDWNKHNGAIASGGADDRIVVHVEDGSDDAFVARTTVEHAHAGDVNCVRWHPKQPGLLASAGDDGHVRLWAYAS